MRETRRMQQEGGSGKKKRNRRKKSGAVRTHKESTPRKWQGKKT